MRIRKALLMGLVACSASGGLAFASTQALAASAYVHDFSFGPAGLGAGSFVKPEEIAVNQATGDVYLYDPGTGGGSVYKFDAAGKPAAFAELSGTSRPAVIEGVGGFGNEEGQIAVDSATGEIYVANGRDVGIYHSGGTPVEVAGEPSVLSGEAGVPWGEPCGVAVDPAGHVYVGLFGSYVNEYTPTAGPVTNSDYTRSLEGLSGICNVAVDSEESVYADGWPAGPVTKYEATQFGSPSPVGEIVDPTDPTAHALGVNPTSGEVYLDQGSDIAVYSSTGSQLSTFSTLNGPSNGVAVCAVACQHEGEVYVADPTSGLVDAFKRVTEAAPTVNDQPPTASGVTRTGALLSGTVDTNGEATSYHFLYVDAADYDPSAAEPYAAGSSTAPGSLGGGAGEATLPPQRIIELQPGTIYHYELVASSALGAVQGPDYTFATAARTPPIVVTGAASGIGQNTVTIEGTLDTQALATNYGFEIGTSTEYGPPTGLGVLDVGAGETPIALTLGGLKPDTTYYYRVTASNLDGTSYGGNGSFTTAGSSSLLALPQTLPLIATPATAFPSGTALNSGKPATKAKTKGKQRTGRRKGRRKATRKKTARRRAHRTNKRVRKGGHGG